MQRCVHRRLMTVALNNRTPPLTLLAGAPEEIDCLPGRHEAMIGPGAGVVQGRCARQVGPRTGPGSKAPQVAHERRVVPCAAPA